MRRAILALGALSLVSSGACGDNVPRCGSAAGLPDAWVLDGEGVLVTIERAPYRVTVRDGSGRVVLASVPGDGDGDGYATVAWTTGTTEYRPELSPGYTHFEAHLDPWRDGTEVVAARRDADALTLTLAAPDGEACVAVTHRIRASALRIEAVVLDGPTPRAWSAAFATPPGEAFLGFGERFNRTNQRGVDVYHWAEEGGLGAGEGTAPGPSNPQPNGEAMTYYPVPFFVSTEGYGFWLDSTWRSEFRLATERPDAWRVWHVGPTLAYEVYLPFATDPRPWPYHLIDAFTARTGRPALPPKWAYGPRRRVGPNDTAMGMPEIEAMRAADLAVTAVDDAVHFFPSGDHVGREEELRRWIARANALGYEVLGYYNSFADRSPESPIAAEIAQAAAAGYFFTLPDGTPPELWILTGGRLVDVWLVDFTNPKAVAWYQGTFAWALSLGYRGWMYDFGEYVPAQVVAHDGRSGEELHNLYPVLYARAGAEGVASGEFHDDMVLFMRSGFTGSSAHATLVWSGDPAASFEDADGLPSMIRAGVNLGVSGVPNWGGDIGGFHCQADGAEAADEELLVRWIQQGAMTPNMQDQNACVGGDREKKATIWTAPRALEAFRRYARLHTRLFPYFYTLGVEASRTGAPILRQPFLEHPEEPRLADVDDAYYLGPALFVAPVVERGARQKTVELPPGRFLDWDTGLLLDGGRTVTLEAPLERIPILLRADRLVPMLDPAIDTLRLDEIREDIVGPRDVADVYDVVGFLSPGGSARFVLYDGGMLEARRDGPFAPPALPEAADETELLTCNGCFRIDPLAGGVTRLRVSAPAGTVTAGGLSLTSGTDRRIRWDLYLAP